MRVVVGTAKTKTPMMAVLMRNAKANPYWHVPPELVRSLTAKKVGEQGLSYFKDFHYEVLSDWSGNAQVIDPETVNWKAIASGKQAPTILVRQLPGPWNSMGKMKFEMPNDFGIYLHDTPHQGAVRQGRPLAQQRLRAAGGLPALRHLGVRARAAGDRAAASKSSSCRGRCRST